MEETKREKDHEFIVDSESILSNVIIEGITEKIMLVTTLGLLNILFFSF